MNFQAFPALFRDYKIGHPQADCTQIITTDHSNYIWRLNRKNLDSSRQLETGASSLYWADSNVSTCAPIWSKRTLEPV